MVDHTYGDVAAVIGSRDVQVLHAAGRVSDGFQWPDQTRTDTPADILSAERAASTGPSPIRGCALGQDALGQLLDR